MIFIYDWFVLELRQNTCIYAAGQTMTPGINSVGKGIIDLEQSAQRLEWCGIDVGSGNLKPSSGI